jgi:hypothetical protein
MNDAQGGGDRPVAHFKGAAGDSKEGGGPAAGMPRGVGAAWGLAPTGGRHPNRPRRASVSVVAHRRS